METNQVKYKYEKISSKAVSLFFRQGIIATVFYIAPAVFCLLVFKFPYVFILSGILSVYQLFLHPRLEYRQWRYCISDKYVDIVHGIFFTKYTHIPISRIQHLDISQGPIQKSLGLASIDIVTAGMSHKIRAIEWEIAQNLLEDMRKRIYEAEESI